MKEARILRIVVASPSDVQAERELLPGIIDELNRGIAADRGLRLELSRWETDAYPGFHPQGPQGLIDPILRIEDCDILIGIFWKRFGTPTSDAKSGTEHEFKLAYEAWKQKGHPQIMVYFNQRAYSPNSKEETDQWGQVLEFRREFPKEGLWWEYRGKAQFENVVRNHLSNIIRKRFLNLSPKHVALKTGGIEDRVLSIIKGFLPQEGLYVSPDIPGTLLSKAKKVCLVPETESVIALMETNILGLAQCFLFFGTKGIYFTGFSKGSTRTITYNEFRGRHFAPAVGGIFDNFRSRVSLGNDQFFYTMNISPDTVADILNKIKDSIIEPNL